MFSAPWMQIYRVKSQSYREHSPTTTLLLLLAQWNPQWELVLHYWMENPTYYASHRPSTHGTHSINCIFMEILRLTSQSVRSASSYFQQLFLYVFRSSWQQPEHKTLLASLATERIHTLWRSLVHVSLMHSFNTFAASYLNSQGLNNSCLKSRQRRP